MCKEIPRGKFYMIFHFYSVTAIVFFINLESFFLARMRVYGINVPMSE